MSLLNTVKKIAWEIDDANVPASFMFGTVTAVSPLIIRVDNRFDISGDDIVVTQEFRAGGVQNHTHNVPNHQTQTAEGHTHPVNQFPSLVGNTGGLVAGDKVVLLRNYGGQQFLVMGRM